MGKLISIEGMDCSGKTALAKALAEKLGYQYISKPILSYFPMEDSTYQNVKANFKSKEIEMFGAGETDLSFWFYGFNNLVASKLAEYNDVVVDRHIVTNAFWNSNLNLGYKKNIDFIKTLNSLYKRPDLVVLLNASESVLEMRLKKRLSEKYKDESNASITKEYDAEKAKFKRAGEFLAFSKKFCEDFEIQYIVLDNGNISLEEELLTVLDRLNKTFI